MFSHNSQHSALKRPRTLTGQYLQQGESEVSNLQNYSKIWRQFFSLYAVDVSGAPYWREETKGFSSQLLKFQQQIPISEEVSIPSSKFSLFNTGGGKNIIKTSDDNQSIPDFSGCNWRLALVDLKIKNQFWVVQLSLLYKTFNYSLIKSASEHFRSANWIHLWIRVRERKREREIADSCIWIK